MYISTQIVFSFYICICLYVHIYVTIYQATIVYIRYFESIIYHKTCGTTQPALDVTFCCAYSSSTFPLTQLAKTEDLLSPSISPLFACGPFPGGLPMTSEELTGAFACQSQPGNLGEKGPEPRLIFCNFRSGTWLDWLSTEWWS